MRYDAIIVGGGSAGLSAAQALARARRRVLVVDAARPRNRFASAMHNVLGRDGTSPLQLRIDGRAELVRYPDASIVDGEAVDATRADVGFHVRLEDGRKFHSRTLVLATGVRDVLPEIEGLAARWGRSVLHCPYCHGFEIDRRAIGVLVGDAMGLHRALMLPDWGPTTCLLQDGFEPDADAQARLQRRGVVLERSPVVALLGAAPGLDGVRLADGRTLALSALFPGGRVLPASPVAETLGCAFEDGPQGPYVRVDATKQTSVPDVFAAGDLAAPMHTVTAAVAAGVLAGVGAHQALIAADCG